MGQSEYTATKRARKYKGMDEKRPNEMCSVFEDALLHCL